MLTRWQWDWEQNPQSQSSCWWQPALNLVESVSLSPNPPPLHIYIHTHIHTHVPPPPPRLSAGSSVQHLSNPLFLFPFSFMIQSILHTTKSDHVSWPLEGIAWVSTWSSLNSSLGWSWSFTSFLSLLPPRPLQAPNNILSYLGVLGQGLHSLDALPSCSEVWKTPTHSFSFSTHSFKCQLRSHILCEVLPDCSWQGDPLLLQAPWVPTTSKVPFTS